MKIVKWFINLNKWFELRFGWFFVNGFKQEEWAEYLKEKYNPNSKLFQDPTKL